MFAKAFVLVSVLIASSRAGVILFSTDGTIVPGFANLQSYQASTSFGIIPTESIVGMKFLSQNTATLESLIIPLSANYATAAIISIASDLNGAPGSTIDSFVFSGLAP